MLKTFIISTIKVILPVANGKFFQHRLIYFIHTNAMNSFSKLKNGEKVMHSRYKLLILLRQICVNMATFQRHYHCVRFKTKRFFNKTDLFYSYQCNEPIFKADIWGKNHE